MSGNLIYPFKHHTKLKDNFFRDLKFYRGRPLTNEESLEMQERLSQGPETWETGKSLFNDIYADFCMGLLSYTDEDIEYVIGEYKKMSPEIAAKFEKVIKSDEMVCSILAGYGQFLIAEFLSFMLRQKLSEEIGGDLDDVYSWYFYTRYMKKISLKGRSLPAVLRLCDTCEFYKQVIFACSHRFLYDYANAYGKDFAAILVKYFDLRTFPPNFPDEEDYKEPIRDVLEDFKFNMNQIYTKKRYFEINDAEQEYENMNKSYEIPVPQAEGLDLDIENYLEDRLKKSLLELEDEAVRSWIEKNGLLDSYFYFYEYNTPERFRRMRGYYAKAQEIWNSVDGYWLKGEEDLDLYNC